MTRRLPPRMLRRLILSAVLGIAFGVAAWYLGMDAAHAIGLGAAAFALTTCLSALGEAADVVWAVPAPQPRPGVRRDIVQLGWSLGARGGRASPEGVRRLRLVAERALLLRGLDLEDRAADARLEELLGADALRLLRRGSGVAPPRTSEVSSALTRLEALEREDAAAASFSSTRADPAAPPAASRQPAPSIQEPPHAR
ncbi:hypothetical protein [Leifsonia sp. NPDC077715]|uniref:hypothetical protein n=1 Tax=Leifsonia sp. NPDC077715 TaxID=3155539 RepID=UPI003444135D